MFVTERPVIVGQVVDSQRPIGQIPVASTSRKKLAEYRSMGLVVEEGREVGEMQDRDPYKVIEQKAITAWIENGGPTLVEDTSFEVDAKDGRPGPLVKHDLGTRADRVRLCKELTLFGDARGAGFRVLLAVYDGFELHIREGYTRGTIAPEPQGPASFGFDDIFIPDGETRTYAEMTLVEKNATSPRMKAAEDWKERPVIVGENVFQLGEPDEAQLGLILKERLAADPKALQFAFGLDALSHVAPNAELAVPELAPVYKETMAGGRILRYIVGKRKTAGQGLVVVPHLELKEVVDFQPGQPPKRKPVRLAVSRVGGEVAPVLMQMGVKATELALASRAREYLLMHSDKMHERVRDLQAKGLAGRALRTNHRSPILEELMGMKARADTKGGFKVTQPAQKAIAPSELGYVRESSSRKVSRKKAARQGLLSVQADLPTMPIALGGMPPTTGSVDTAVTAAMSYMRSWVPHNGIFAGDYQRQLDFFAEAKAKIAGFNLPEDIQKVCTEQIGLSVGCEDPAAIAEQARKFKAMGGKSIRIYTTNPGIGVLETAEAIRQAVGKDFTICVGPIADVAQARVLRDRAGVNMFIVGHGGGENCTSLEGGGAANAIALLYEMNLDAGFNNCVLGMEGGVGTNYGPLLSLCDFFSLNGKAVGGIEPTGGLYVKHKSGLPVLPYHGSASVITQKIEALCAFATRSKRLDEAGMVENVEGKPNYKPKKDWANSIVNFFQATRAYLGLALADMDSMDIFEFRQRIARQGYNIVGVSTDAHNAAYEHRSMK